MVALLITASLGVRPLAKSFFNTGLLGAAGTSGEASDDQFNRVSFLSHFEGSNNGVNNAFEDGSGQSRSLSNYRNPAQGSFGPFARPDGEWGWNFDGSGDNLKVPDSTDFDCGTGDFCLELFIFSGGASSNPLLVTFGGGFYLQLKDSMTDISFYTGSTEIIYSGSASLTNNAWHHIAITREGSSLRHFLDGSLVKTTSNSDAVNGSGEVLIGTNTNGSSLAWTGFISNLRLVNGSAVYTSAFTVSTSKLTAITNTKLLTCQSNRFLDNSASGHTVTPSGNAAVTAFGPFLSSAVYDPANGASSQLGAVNSVEIATGTWAQLGTGDFTWEYWIYPIAVNNYHLGSGTSGQNLSSTFTLGMSNKQLILYYTADGTAAHLLATSGTPVYNLNEWHHLAYVRAGNVHKIYANGILATSETRSGAMANSTGPTIIGQFGTGGAYGYGAEGIYGDVRLVKGTAVYSGSTYTVPTAPLTAISNTELLLNFKNGQAIDSAAQSNMTLHGDANTSTDQAKFGNTSLHLDGTGDFAKTELSTEFGTGDFTIECFYYNSASFANANKYLFDFGSNGLRVQFYNGTIYYFVDANNSVTTTAAGVTHNNWYHLAAVRYNGQMNLYIGGVSRATKDSVTTNLTERSLTIGDYGGGGQALQGFIDEFRISNFARYTSNFTAPAEPFADKGR